MRSLQKQFATQTVGTFQGYGLLQRLQALQNTRNVMPARPARHASGTTELKAVKIIGTRKPFQFWFFE